MKTSPDFSLNDAASMQSPDLETILHGLSMNALWHLAMPTLRKNLMAIAKRNPEQPMEAMARYLQGMGCKIPQIEALAAHYRAKETLGWSPPLEGIAAYALNKARR